MLKLKPVTDIHPGDQLARSGEISHLLEIVEVQEINRCTLRFFEIRINDILYITPVNATLVVWED